MACPLSQRMSCLLWSWRRFWYDVNRRANMGDVLMCLMELVDEFVAVAFTGLWSKGE
jgi:hypothetical protein